MWNGWQHERAIPVGATVEADQREALLDETAKHPGYFYADVFRKVSESLAVEHFPFPPSDHVSIARIVHLLAMRTVAKSHPSLPAGMAVIVPHEARYLAYLDAALTLNEAIDRAAKAGAIRLRDRSTGVAVPDWHLPTWDRRDSLKRLILGGEHRRAIEFVVSSDWLVVPYPHFSPLLTVSTSEFSAWAENERLAGPGEIGRLLDGQPKHIPTLADFFNSIFGRLDVDLEAGLYPEKLRQEAERPAGPFGADVCTVDSETSDTPKEWARGIRRVAFDAAKAIVAGGGELTARGLEMAMLNSKNVELKKSEYQLQSTNASLGDREMKAKPKTIAGWVTDLKKLLNQ